MRYSIIGLNEGHQFFTLSKKVLGDVVPFPGDIGRMEVVKGGIPRGSDNTLDFSHAVIILTENASDKLISDMEKLSRNKGVRVLKGYSIPNEFSHVDDMDMAIKEWVRNGSWPDNDPFSEDDLFGDDDDDLFGDEPDEKLDEPVEPEPTIEEKNPRLAGVMNTNDGWGFDGEKSDAHTPEPSRSRGEVQPVEPIKDDDDFLPNLSEPTSNYEMEDTAHDEDDEDESVTIEFIDPDVNFSDIDEGPAKKGVPSNSGRSGLDDAEGESPTDDINLDPDDDFSISDVRDLKGTNPSVQRGIEMEDELVGDLLDPGEIQTPGDFQDKENRVASERNRKMFQDNIYDDPSEIEKVHPHEEDDPPYFQHMNDAQRITQKEKSKSSRVMHGIGSEISPRSKMVFVTGTSGGVGKTTISYSLATFTAKAMKYLNRKGGIEGTGRDVYLIEIDWSNSKLQNLLDSSNSLMTVIEAVKKNASFRRSDLASLIIRSTSKQASGLHVIPAPHNDNYTSENYSHMIVSLVAVLSYLMSQEEGTIIFLDSGNLEPVIKDRVARTIFSKFSPEVVLVTRLDAVSMVVKAKDTLTTAPEGAKVVDGKVVGTKGYGVPNEKISVVVNRVPRDADKVKVIKQMIEDFKVTSPLGLHCVIPEMSSLRVSFVNQIAKSESEEIERFIGKFLSVSLGFPEFRPLVEPTEHKRNTPKPGFLKRMFMKKAME